MIVNEADEAPIVLFVNKMLLDAIKIGASDLHFEPYEKFYRVRFRVDEKLRVVASPPVGLARKLASRIKVMSQLNVLERRLPQEGRIKLEISANVSVDFRVRTCPNLWGEKIVMHVLDSSAARLNLDRLVYEEELDVYEEELLVVLVNDKEKVDETPIVKFVNQMLLDALEIGASDLYFDPDEKSYQVRFRVDGILREVARPPVALARQLAAGIKVMSHLNVLERRVPQEGRIKLKISANESVDCWVRITPNSWGEQIVMRILASSAVKLNLDRLGYEEEQKRLYLKALASPYGIVLVAGPTESGKTVSLYKGINLLNKEDVNISTVEKLVEINLPGVNQVQVDEKTGMTFVDTLKDSLQQDPDIIVVDEIRDLETGEIAIKAAAMGYMVMSTLPTNDAPQTLTAMTAMGIPAVAIATYTKLIIAQRLCRCLCSCKVEQDIPKKTLLQEGFKKEEIANLKLYGPRPGGM